MGIKEDKKKERLGMHVSVANRRLQKDMLFSLCVRLNENRCYRCGNQMTRDDFTMDHVIPWINSVNPVKLYFDVSNVKFSHHSCNSRAGAQNS